MEWVAYLGSVVNRMHVRLETLELSRVDPECDGSARPVIWCGRHPTAGVLLLLLRILRLLEDEITRDLLPIDTLLPVVKADLASLGQGGLGAKNTLIL